MRTYACSVCLKPERFNEVTGEVDVEVLEIWLDKPLPVENKYRYAPVTGPLRVRIFAHKRCAEQYEEFIELRDILNDHELCWKDKQRAICKSLTRLTDLMSMLPMAESPDWRPEFVVPEDYYAH